MKTKTDNKYAAKRQELDMAAWMNQAPHPLPLLSSGQKVDVYRERKWISGVVTESNPNGCVVRLPEQDQLVRIYDARCIKAA